MDFNKLLAQMKEIDSPTNEACGMGLGPMANVPNSMPPEPQSSMNLNINAQGIDDIESIMNLMHRVNPDMMPAADAPQATLGTITPGIIDAEPDAMNAEPLELPAEPTDSMVDPAEKSDAEPDMDNDEVDAALADEPDPADEPEGDSGFEEEPASDDADDDKEEDTDEGVYANSSDEEEKDVDTMVNKLSGGINDRDHKTYPKVADGDNPMQKVKEGSWNDEIQKLHDGPKQEKPKKSKPGDITKDQIDKIEHMDAETAQEYAMSLIKASPMKMNTKVRLMHSIRGNWNPIDIMQTMYNSFLSKEGHWVRGSSWQEDIEQKHSVEAIREHLRKELNRIKGITNESTVKEATSREITDQFPVYVEDDLVDADVTYYIDGSHRPATRYEPAEYPEIVITRVVDGETGQDITDEILGSRQEEMLRDKIADAQTDPADDYDDPDTGWDESMEDIKNLSGIQTEANDDELSGHVSRILANVDRDMSENRLYGEPDVDAVMKALEAGDAAEAAGIVIEAYADENGGSAYDIGWFDAEAAQEDLAAEFDELLGNSAAPKYGKQLSRSMRPDPNAGNGSPDRLAMIKKLAGLR